MICKLSSSVINGNIDIVMYGTIDAIINVSLHFTMKSIWYLCWYYTNLLRFHKGSTCESQVPPLLYPGLWSDPKKIWFHTITHFTTDTINFDIIVLWYHITNLWYYRPTSGLDLKESKAPDVNTLWWWVGTVTAYGLPVYLCVYDDGRWLLAKLAVKVTVMAVPGTARPRGHQPGIMMLSYKARRSHSLTWQGTFLPVSCASQGAVGTRMLTSFGSHESKVA